MPHNNPLEQDAHDFYLTRYSLEVQRDIKFLTSLKGFIPPTEAR